MSLKHTIAFYNIENLFDTKDDINTHDDDFLPHAERRWTTKRYQNKIRKIGKVIAQIGSKDNENPPAIIGLAEVENRHVVKDLTEGKHLKAIDYGIAHFDSSDERGIDVALLYNKAVFELEHTEPFSVYLEREEGVQDFTRDILLVTGKLNGEQIHIIVNHWSSRREGEKETEFKRLAAAERVNQITQVLHKKFGNPKVIVMGDFNDTPQNNSLSLIENGSNLYNPFKTISTLDKGSLNHRFEWLIFDQILFSTNFFDSKSTKFNIGEANVFNSKFLTEYKGKYKGLPFRTYVGKRYKGGYSDHFPVYLELKE